MTASDETWIHPIQALDAKRWVEVMVSKGHDHDRHVYGTVCPTIRLELRGLLDIERDQRLQRPRSEAVLQIAKQRIEPQELDCKVRKYSLCSKL